MKTLYSTPEVQAIWERLEKSLQNLDSVIQDVNNTCKVADTKISEATK